MGNAVKITLLHERVLLGSALKNKEIRKRILQSLVPSDFVDSKHQKIFSAIREMHERSLEYVPATIASLCETIDKKEFELLEHYAVEPENIDFHISRSRWDRARCQVFRDYMGKLEACLRDPRSETFDAVRIAKEIEAVLSQARDETPFVQGAGAAAEYLMKLEARKRDTNPRSSGYPILDSKLTTPFAPGKLSVIAACPSIGKTTFALNLASKQAHKWKVGYIPWESGHTAAVDIICSHQLDIPLNVLVKHPERLTDEDSERIEGLLSILYGNPGESKHRLSFLRRPPATIIKAKYAWEINNQVIDWFENQLETWDREIIYWDLFEKLLPDRSPQAISWAIDRIQAIAQKHSVHIVLLHQIALKTLERESDKRPKRSHLKGTGAYIEAPDLVIGLYRDAVYSPGLSDTELEVLILKQRNGIWPLRLIFDWHGQTCRVSGGREERFTIDDDDGLV